MVALSDVVAANEGISHAFPKGLTAVFVGGTSGVGEYTLKAFAKAVPQPVIYFVGRSQSDADRIIDECNALQPNGRYEFIKADVSLLANVDDLCEKIKARTQILNLLFLSQGSMALEKTTGDGLPLATMLATHSRLRFILNLLPLLERAESLRRVVNVGAGTCEGPIDTNNLHGTGFPLMKWRDQIASITTLLLQEVARHAPSVGFIHNVPGVVKSNIARDAEGFGIMVMVAISKLLGPIIQTPPAECAQRQLFQATSARYAAGESGNGTAADPDKGRKAHCIDGGVGSGVYSVDVACESASSKVVGIVHRLNEDGTAQKVWMLFREDLERLAGDSKMWALP